MILSFKTKRAYNRAVSAINLCRETFYMSLLIPAGWALMKGGVELAIILRDWRS